MDTKPVQVKSQAKFLLLVLVLVSLFYYLKKPQSSLKSITIGSTKVMVEIADSEPERSKGLSNRESLGDNQGMLFLYQVPGKYSFWMKDMLFPLDFIWIRENKIVDIAINVPNPTSSDAAPVILNQAREFDAVLEVNAGFVQENGIKVGDKAEIN